MILPQGTSGTVWNRFFGLSPPTAGHCWHLVGRGQECRGVSDNGQDSPEVCPALREGLMDSWRTRGAWVGLRRCEKTGQVSAL